jgi:hypothetical protein
MYTNNIFPILMNVFSSDLANLVHTLCVWFFCLFFGRGGYGWGQVGMVWGGGGWLGRGKTVGSVASYIQEDSFDIIMLILIFSCSYSSQFLCKTHSCNFKTQRFTILTYVHRFSYGSKLSSRLLVFVQWAMFIPIFKKT